MISLIVTLIILGVILYLVDQLLPMDPSIRRVVQVVILLCVLLYILRFFGIA